VYGQPVSIIRGLEGASRAARRQQEVYTIQREIRLAPVEPVTARLVQATLRRLSPAPPRQCATSQH